MGVAVYESSLVGSNGADVRTPIRDSRWTERDGRSAVAVRVQSTDFELSGFGSGNLSLLELALADGCSRWGHLASAW